MAKKVRKNSLKRKRRYNDTIRAADLFSVFGIAPACNLLFYTV